MNKASRHADTIVQGDTKVSLSRGQKAFNSLIKQIEKRRARLRAWEIVTPTFQKQYVDELLPLEQELTNLQIKMVYRLDQAWGQKGLTKAERCTLSELIADLSGNLVEECDDPQFKAIYNQHSQSDYDSEAAAELEDMKSALEMMLGVKLGDDVDMRSPEEVLQRAHAQMQEQRAQVAAESLAREERRAKRKRSAKEMDAQARQEKERTELSQSIREVYRKLASALHPDRESDPHERERKNTLMQLANQAYGKNDLLRLLELQLELEHIDQSAINNINEDRLKHYNKILREQLGELDQEILHVEAGFRQAYGIPPFIEVSPKTILRNLAHDVAALRQDVYELKEELLMFEDLKQIKVWLKRLKRQQAAIRFIKMPL
jgi:Skp family chaperone for outer membrane proteins